LNVENRDSAWKRARESERNKSRGKVSQFGTQCNDQLEGDLVTNVTQIGLRSHNCLECNCGFPRYPSSRRSAELAIFCRTSSWFLERVSYDCENGTLTEVTSDLAR